MLDALTVKRHWQIRRIFLHRSESYGVSEAVRLLSIPRKELAAGIARGEIDAEGDRLTWQTVAILAVEKWGIEAIQYALGRDVHVLPSLLRFEPVTIYLPAYLIHYLSHRAEVSGVTIDQQAANDLHLAIDPDEVDRMDAAISGFREAVMFPA